MSSNRVQRDKPFLQLLTETAFEALGADRSTVFLNDNDANELYARFAQDEVKREIRFPNDVGIAGHVFTANEPLIIDDAYADSRFNPDVDQSTGYRTRSLLTLPMTSARGEVVGVLQVLNKKTGKFSESDLVLMKDITMQAALALRSDRNIRRERRQGDRGEPDADRRLHRAELLLNVSRRVADTEGLDGVLAALVEITVDETKSERGTLFLNDEQTEELYARVAQGSIRRELRFPNTSGIAGHVFTVGEGLIIHDAYADERFNQSLDEQTGFKTRSILCAPIRTVKGQVIGVAQMLNKATDDYSDADMGLLESLTMQAAMALQSNQYMERLQRSRKEEMEFLDVVTDVTSEIELGVLLRKVMREATRMLRADRSTLFLHDEKTRELWSEVGEGLETTQIRLPNNVGIAGTVFTTGKSVNIPYAYADLRFNPGFDKQTGYFTRSILCVPVVNKSGKVIGVTQMLNKRGGPFSDEDEARLRAFTGQVSIALENATLFNDIQNMKNYSESVLESMTNGVITLDEDGEIVTGNRAALRIVRSRGDDVVGKSAEEFFTGKNGWVVEKVKRVEESEKSESYLDAELEFWGNRVSANVTIHPLISTEKKKLGTLIMIEDISNEKRMRSTMSRYMDPSIADSLLGGTQDMLGGRNVDATVMFTDIRGFTSLTEEIGPPGTVALLNEYFSIMVDCIQQEEGMLDKFIGDAIMAAFGLPIAHDDDEDRAVRAAVSMITRLWEWNTARNAKGYKSVDMGVGLHTDTVVSGNIGSPKRMDFTMIGDGVNLASRLEGACKTYSARILISETTFRKLRGTYRTREVDQVVVQGRTAPVGVYEVLDYHSPESFPNMMEAVNHFRDGIQHYRDRHWDKGIRAFKKSLELAPEDKLAATYVERCTQLKRNPPSKDWDGVWVMTSK